MWCKLTRTKYKEYSAATEDSFTDVSLRNYKKIPGTQSEFDVINDCVPNNGTLRSIDGCVVRGADEISNTYASQSCKCSPLLSIRKHFFGSLKLRPHSKSCSSPVKLSRTRAKAKESCEMISCIQLEHLCDLDKAIPITSAEQLQNTNVLESEHSSVKDVVLDKSNYRVENSQLTINCCESIEKYNAIDREQSLQFITENTSDIPLDLKPENIVKSGLIDIFVPNERVDASENMLTTQFQRIDNFQDGTPKEYDNSQEDSSMIVARVKSSPPKLKRREKSKTNEVTESRKSRLSSGSTQAAGKFLDSNVQFKVELAVSHSRPVNVSVVNEERIIVVSDQIRISPDIPKVEVLNDGSYINKTKSSVDVVDFEQSKRSSGQWSSPDIDIEEDTEEKESGYTTLEEAAAQSERTRSSCSSEEFLGPRYQPCTRKSNGIGSFQSLSISPGNEIEYGHERNRVDTTGVVTNGCAEVLPDRSVAGSSGLVQTQLHNKDEPLLNAHYQSTCTRTLETNLDRSLSRDRGHADYVKADCSVSKIYEDTPTSTLCSDGTVRALHEIYASVPKTCFKSDDEGCLDSTPLDSCESTPRKTANCPKIPPKTLDILDKSRILLQSGGRVFEQTIKNNDEIDEINEEIHKVDMNGVESDDGEYLPPIPSRNYETSASATWSDSGNELSPTAITWLEKLEASNEASATHMSWDELMREAQSLGIPLSGPYSDTDRRSQTSSPAVSDTNDVRLPLNSRSSSPISSADRSPAHRRTRTRTDTTSSNDSSKSSSPFRDRFHLPKPFSRKVKPTKSIECAAVDRSNGTAVHRFNSAVDIQKRCLPVPPKPSRQISAPSHGNACVADENRATPSFDTGPRKTASNLSLQHRAEIPMRLWDNNSPAALIHTNMSDSSGSSNSVFSRSSHGYNTGSSDVSHSLNPSGYPPPSIQEAIFRGHPSSQLLSDIDNENSTTDEVTSHPSMTSSNGNTDFIQSFSKLKECGWYWGPLGWYNAELQLSNASDGSFLVRDSSDDRYILSLSFRSQGVTHHTRIEHYKGMFSFYSQPKSHGASTIVEFIEKAMEHSRNGKFLYFLRPRAPGMPPAPVQLLHPVSRLRNMHTLQHLCRFVTVRHVRRDLIDRLPIPPRLKEYLKETQYYTECAEDDDLSTWHQYFTNE